MENNGYENGDILCNSTNVSVISGVSYTCDKALIWNSTNKFASPGNESRTFTLYFPKTYVSVQKIQIKTGNDLRYLYASNIDSSLDGINYKRVMSTNVPFCI